MKSITIVLLCVVGLGFVGFACADEVAQADKGTTITKPKTVVSGMLRTFMAQRKRGGHIMHNENGTKHCPFVADSETILVDIHTTTAHDATAAEQELINLGMKVTGRASNVISGFLPYSAVDTMDKVSNIAACQPALAFTRKGSVNTAGETAMRLPLNLGGNALNGTGITVGILSDSFNRYGGATDDISTGDLPSNIIVYQEGSSGGDEGRAMMQIIHDIAPAARLMFATAFSGAAGFANNILALAGCPSGSPQSCQPAPYPAKVIVDDVGYFAEPAFSDGIIAQAVNLVHNAGVTYVSAMGNQGNDAWQGRFYPGERLAPGYFQTGSAGAQFFGGNPMNIRHANAKAGGQPYYFIPFDVLAGQVVVLNLHWQQPSRSAMGGIGGCQNDLDFYALEDTNGDGVPDAVLAVSAEVNGLYGEPFEILQFTPSQTGRIYLMVVYYTGEDATDELVRITSMYAGSFPPSLGTGAPTGWGHPNSAGAIGVAAAFARNTPAYCNPVAQLEAFSSYGGTPILFNATGHPIYELRERPDLTAPDGALNTFFGSLAKEGYLFYGTSAAAPHVAGVVALMLQARPSLTPPQVRSSLRTGCEDMDDPYTSGFQSGFDFASGAGLVNAYAAIVAAQNLSPKGTLPSQPQIIPGCVEPPPRF